MRLWLPVEERRESPPPFPTNDATALFVGLVLWVAGFAALLIAPSFGVEVSSEALSTGVIGVLLGTVGLLYTRLRGGNS